MGEQNVFLVLTWQLLFQLLNLLPFLLCIHQDKVGISLGQFNGECSTHRIEGMEHHWNGKNAFFHLNISWEWIEIYLHSLPSVRWASLPWRCLPVVGRPPRRPWWWPRRAWWCPGWWGHPSGAGGRGTSTTREARSCPQSRTWSTSAEDLGSNVRVSLGPGLFTKRYRASMTASPLFTHSTKLTHLNWRKFKSCQKKVIWMKIIVS